MKAAKILLVLGALAAPAPATAESLTLNRVKSLLGEMGFKPKPTEDEALTLEGLGSRGANLFFRLSKNGTALTIYKAWPISADKQDVIPGIAMLKANNGHPFSFALFGEPGERAFDIEKTVDGALVSKAMLRKSIDQMLEMIDSNEALWDTDSWPIKAK
ncbi:hypothetical protein [Methylobacterium haplocladii]|nr:hypothetical protein [Methylobacterium haplocladii]GJD82818.1 hypothetical protein HPGCJGGD_0679 [Methylobacterium haplocladii]GLS60542.1 hypothetical protein GCM10007887_32210 [Methylobacterium haplocladii]